MDLRLFHPNDGKIYNHKITDRRNRRTRFFACNFQEWMGWYNNNIAQRLLGHYRLYQLFKHKYLTQRTELPPIQAYILQYRETLHLKLFFPRIIALVQPIIEFGMTNRQIEIHSINRMLLYQRSDILQEFLTDAEEDFEQAFLIAMKKILDPQFLYTPPSNPEARRFFVQINEEHQYNATFSKNEFHVHPTVHEQPATEKHPKGKEKDVFSKKQILIFFNLLAQKGFIEPIDLRKPDKFKDIAPLLRAISGHGEESWKAQLNDYRNKDLYAYHSEGERQELIRILITLSNKLNNAGFKSIANLADQKIIELEHAAR